MTWNDYASNAGPSSSSRPTRSRFPAARRAASRSRRGSSTRSMRPRGGGHRRDQREQRRFQGRVGAHREQPDGRELPTRRPACDEAPGGLAGVPRLGTHPARDEGPRRRRRPSAPSRRPRRPRRCSPTATRSRPSARSTATRRRGTRCRCCPTSSCSTPSTTRSRPSSTGRNPSSSSSTSATGSRWAPEDRRQNGRTPGALADDDVRRPAFPGRASSTPTDILRAETAMVPSVIPSSFCSHGRPLVQFPAVFGVARLARRLRETPSCLRPPPCTSRGLPSRVCCTGSFAITSRRSARRRPTFATDRGSRSSSSERSPMLSGAAGSRAALRVFVAPGAVLIGSWRFPARGARSVRAAALRRGSGPSRAQSRDGGRRMAERAAHLVDHVFPDDVPVRQWVLSLPHRLRYILAWDHDLCRAVAAIVARAVSRVLRERARDVGIRGGRGGGVVVIQRFPPHGAQSAPRGPRDSAAR